MVFVTADSCRLQLERLTQLLVSAFPGSTIYQHINLGRVPHDTLSHNVDAVFLSAEMVKTNELDYVQMLRRHKSNLPVFIISQTEDFRKEAADAGATDFFVRPITGQQLMDAIQAVKNKENAS